MDVGPAPRPNQIDSGALIILKAVQMPRTGGLCRCPKCSKPDGPPGPVRQLAPRKPERQVELKARGPLRERVADPFSRRLERVSNCHGLLARKAKCGRDRRNRRRNSD
jgi:hypothetical protein